MPTNSSSSSACRRWWRPGVPAEPGQQVPRPVLGLRRDQHVLDDGEPGEDPGELEGPADAGGEHLVRREAGDRVVAEPDLARVGPLVAGDHVEQRGLAGAVRPDQAGDGALLDGDRRAVQRLDAAVGLHDSLGAQQGGHRAPPELTGGADGVGGRAAPIVVAGTTAGRPLVRILVMNSPPVGMMPRGMNSTTSRKIAAEHDLAQRPAERGLGVQPERQRLDDQRAEHRAGDRAVPAEERHQHQREVEQRVEAGLRLDLVEVVEPDRADQRGDRAGDHERGQLDPHGLDAEAARPVLVVPDRPELQAEPGPPDQPGDGDRADREGERDVVEGRVVAAPAPSSGTASRGRLTRR